ncbi:potassium channel family protein [Oscillatoria sp. FACHB-1406]|uniref:potassium channel family protein n=1 Tax=Oscillatoria sp. FACHB-1406 TaxID=2692846 RepID=UPI001681DB01|nr:potassium channel family protein [Oscillatoria sp. FACHB-1406]MBD2579651.1 two pore domain potassium channel family protein [Oscillatoria sp. FACHB-1406]
MELEPEKNGKPPVEFENEALVQAIAQSIVDRVNLFAPSADSPSEVLQQNCYPRHRRLIRVRVAIGVFTAIGLLYSIFNTFHQVFPHSHLVELALFPSLLSLFLGLALVVLLILEIFIGAGMDIEVEVKKANKVYKEYQFIPSFSKLPYLLLFLGLSFFAILLGFASFNSELYRSDPSNFDGFQEGFIAIYFSIVTFSTVGYGDIHPVSYLARTAAICEIFIAMFFNLIALSMTLSWVMAYEQSQHAVSIKNRIQKLHQQTAKSELERDRASKS